jgi:hypothetical protein
MTIHLPEGLGANATVPSPAPEAGGPVVFYRCSDSDRPPGHGVAAKKAMARTMATLLGRGYGDDFDRDRAYADTPYFVPNDTLVASHMTRRMGILDESNLFGGVVPFPFVATKVITHPLPGPDSPAPEGWVPEFPRQVADVVLPGFSAFSLPDVLLAGRQLLEGGAVRLKLPDGIGGLGQTVVLNRRELESAAAALDPSELARQGIVIERNLADVETFSVGQTRFGELLISYCGTQRLTRSNNGTQVYGGSRLLVARGGWSELLALGLEPDHGLAVDQARVYHNAALATFSGMFASRCNYDVALGVDDEGMRRSGVLEQSWRIGGATGAELAALAAFQANPDVDSVRASTTEVYGDSPDPPDGSIIYYRGVDANVGALTKYARIEPNGHP